MGNHISKSYWIGLVLTLWVCADAALAQQASPAVNLQEIRETGRAHSAYRQRLQAFEPQSFEPAMQEFREQIRPALTRACVECHGANSQEGNMRIDTLDPDLVHGGDVPRWLEVLAVVSNGEMPPADAPKVDDAVRSQIVQWLSSELHKASVVRRAEQPHSSFRRMTRYETNYALQDLLGVPYDFVRDLPPETSSEDGFQNSSELLHMSANQLAAYREVAIAALKKVTVTDSKPTEIYWGVSMQVAWLEVWQKHEKEIEGLKRKHEGDAESLDRELKRKNDALSKPSGHAHYKDLATGLSLRAHWDYYDAKYARQPSQSKPAVPASSQYVAIVPPRQRVVVELGDTVPDSGTLRVRVRASRASANQERSPSMQLEFGWQASNDSQASVRISQRDIVVDAPPEDPQFYQWDVPLCEVHPRNSMRKTWKLGDLPNPSEFLRIVNSSVSSGDLQIDYVEVTAPVYDQWPPASHARIFIDTTAKDDEKLYASQVLRNFLKRAWRRSPTDFEVQQKLNLFTQLRTQSESFEQAMVEVLATVLASPKFLYIARAHSDRDGKTSATVPEPLPEEELATRLAMFLWCSIPDEQLMQLAAEGRLRQELPKQVDRMLADQRARRFAEQFVTQWLGLQLLEYLKVESESFPTFDASLKQAMLEEPVLFFQEVLNNNHSVLDFLHADYALVNERLAQHYGLEGVVGNHFRSVKLSPTSHRGGLLTQAGLLAMNSDGKDSHPLKRGIWLLKSLLNDPPPPPPPAVPIIDLADPAIAKMTIKQRIENHRNQAACLSCHSKIDPWGIAFENFDAVGQWRSLIGGEPVDASSVLFNGEKIDGVAALKRYLLEHRQDQFIRAMVHKLLTFALGRPLTFGDHAMVDKIAAETRAQNDGLATMVKQIVSSELFQSR